MPSHKNSQPKNQAPAKPEGPLSVHSPAVAGQKFETEGLHNDYEICVVLPLEISNRDLCEQLQAVYDDNERSPSGHFDVDDNSDGRVKLTFRRDLFDDLAATGNEDAKTVTKEWCIELLLREFDPQEGDGEAVHALGQALSARSAVCALYRLDGSAV
jgi:hypothetical protein